MHRVQFLDILEGRRQLLYPISLLILLRLHTQRGDFQVHQLNVVPPNPFLLDFVVKL